MDRTKRTRRENAAYVMTQIRERGFKPSPSSRFGKMETALSGPVFISSTHPDFETVLEAERDITELAFIFDNSEAFNGSSEFEYLLKRALKDSVLPQENTTESPGRDAQFHLYVAAICQKAGMNPTFHEPDLICTVDGAKYGIAAKRVKSIEKLEARVRSARDQIDRAGLLGIAAIELTLAWNRENSRLPVLGHEDEFAAGYLQALKQFGDENIESLRQLARGSKLRGAMIHTTHIGDAKNGDACALAFSYGLPLAQFNRRRELEFHQFKAQYDQGLDRPQNRPFRVPQRRRR